MSREGLLRGRPTCAGVPTLLTTVTHGRAPLLRAPAAAEAVLATLEWLHAHHRMTLHAAVVMPDHVHFVCVAHVPLARLLHSFKSYTANRINHLLGRSGPLWQPGYHDRGLRTGQAYRRAVAYVLDNPARAGLTGPDEPYPYLRHPRSCW